MSCNKMPTTITITWTHDVAYGNSMIAYIPTRVQYLPTDELVSSLLVVGSACTNRMNDMIYNTTIKRSNKPETAQVAKCMN